MRVRASPEVLIKQLSNKIDSCFLLTKTIKDVGLKQIVN